MRARAAAFAGAVGLAAASWSTTASAAPFDLVWSAPEGCPSREEIVQATRVRLGESPSEARPELFVQGMVTAQDSRGYVVMLAMTDASGHSLGEREVRVEHESCREIEAPTSLVLAMMIAVAHPPSAAHPREEPPAATKTPGPQVTTPAVATRPAAPAAAVAPSRRLLVGATGVGSTGILPAVGIGFGVRAAYSPGAGVLVGVETSFETSRAVRVAGGEIGFQLFSANARVGLSVLRTTVFELIPTLGARGVLLRTTPTGFTAVHNDIRSTMLAGPGLLARAKLAPQIFAEVLPELEAVFIRDRFRIREEHKLYHIHRPSPFEGRLSIGIAVEFR